MKKSAFSALNIILIFALVILSTIRSHGSVVEGMGFAVAAFVIGGALFGLLFLWTYGLIKNASNPDNKFKRELRNQLTAALVGGIAFVIISLVNRG